MAAQLYCDIVVNFENHIKVKLRICFKFATVTVDAAVLWICHSLTFRK